MGTNKELLNCPFCGGEAKIHDNACGRFWLSCKDKYCCESTTEESEEEAIKAWNTRATTTEVKVDVEKLVEFAKGVKKDFVNMSQSYNAHEITDMWNMMCEQLGGEIEHILTQSSQKSKTSVDECLTGRDGEKWIEEV